MQFSEFANLFRDHVSLCIKKVQLLLEKNRCVREPYDVPHSYQDKYLLAECITNQLAYSHMHSILNFGINTDTMKLMSEWAKTKEVSIRFECIEKCRFVKEVQREIENSTVSTRRKSISAIVADTFAARVVTLITEYVFEYSVDYKFIILNGVGGDDSTVINLPSTFASQLITVKAKISPFVESKKQLFDVDITWLLLNLNTETGSTIFQIDRTEKNCHTPRRNKDVDQAIAFVTDISEWANSIHNYFIYTIFAVQSNYSARECTKPDYRSINCNSIYSPIVSLFEENSVVTEAAASLNDTCDVTETENDPGNDDDDDDDGDDENEVESSIAVLDKATIYQLLDEERRSMQVKNEEINLQFESAATGRIICDVSAMLCVKMLHIQQVCTDYASSILYIEEMLRCQLIAAIGKTLQPEDFTHYMRFHNRKLFRDVCSMKSFSHSVRRSKKHSPEGMVRIDEKLSGGGIADPISTVCSCRSNGHDALEMSFLLNATSRVKFIGERYVHAWLTHSFHGQQLPNLTLVAQARQFSSFILLVGRIASAALFEPKHAIIVQNKDELLIPLLLEQIPSAKEFKDAVESLSPEQQRFAQSYRSLQLESTLFGVCIIQIKPQMEKILRLPPDSLTKEIQLTQDLMDLFIKYQIPSDLLSFDGDDFTTNASVKLSQVQDHVHGMKRMLEQAKKQEVDAINQTRRFQNIPPPPPPQPTNYPEDLEYCDEGSCCVEESIMRCSAGGGGRGRGESAREIVRLEKAECSQKTSLLSSISSSIGALAKARKDTILFADVHESAAAVPATVVTRARKTTENTKLEQPVTATAGADSVAEASNDLQSRPAVVQPVAPARAPSEDLTQLPALLDRQFLLHDVDHAIRPTKIMVGAEWTKKSTASLLAAEVTSQLNSENQDTARSAAFDLLDALTRSGALLVENATLHVMIAATHCFDKSLMDTVVQNNMNPIDCVERSMLIMASTVHGLPACELVNESHMMRLTEHSPQLFDALN